MHTFSCFSFRAGQVIPNLTFIVAEGLQRAREVARREILEGEDDLAVEIFEDNKLLWAGTFERA